MEKEPSKFDDASRLLAAFFESQSASAKGVQRARLSFSRRGGGLREVSASVDAPGEGEKGGAGGGAKQRESLREGGKLEAVEVWPRQGKILLERAQGDERELAPLPRPLSLDLLPPRHAQRDVVKEQNLGVGDHNCVG